MKQIFKINGFVNEEGKLAIELHFEPMPTPLNAMVIMELEDIIKVVRDNYRKGGKKIEYG